MKYYKTLLSFFSIIFTSYALVSFTPNIHSDDDVKPETSEETKDSKKSDSKDMKGGKGKKKEYESVEEFLEDGEYKAIDGFMNILHETKKDKYFLVLEEDQLNKEFIYFAYILNGPQDVGASGGSMGDGSILEFRKFKDDIGLYKINTKYTYDDSNAISQSKLTNIIEAFMGRFKIAVKEEGKFVINVDKLFLSEMLEGITPNIPKEYMEYYDLSLGRMDKEKTFINDVRNYSKNTAVEVNYCLLYTSPSPRDY